MYIKAPRTYLNLRTYKPRTEIRCFPSVFSIKYRTDFWLLRYFVLKSVVNVVVENINEFSQRNVQEVWLYLFVSLKLVNREDAVPVRGTAEILLRPSYSQP
jgi:hypothetical protein